MDHDLEDDDMVPEKDLNGSVAEFVLHVDPDQVFNQQRAVVAKLSRDDLEDRYLRLLEENVVIKKHACKQEDKIKKLATKLIRVLSDKKRLEMASGGVPTRHRDIETEELIEDQQHKIRDLERQVGHLREKLMVSRQQLMGSGKGVTSGTTTKVKRSNLGPPGMRPTSQGGGGAMSPSPVPASMAGPGPLLNQQAQRLLEEARTENRLLEETIITMKEQVNLFEQEVEHLKQQFRIKDSNYDEEIQILKGQVLDGQRHTATENIQLIQLHQDNNIKKAQVHSLKAQVEGFEESAAKLRSESQRAQNELKDISHQWQEEQKKTIRLSEELASKTASKHDLVEIEEKVRDLQKENVILRESNNKLLDSAYNLERERQFQATENALKVQIAQLEMTLKSDLSDKGALQDALMREREQYAKIESEHQDLQAKYFALKENIEGQEEKLAYFARENSIDMKQLEDALLILRQKKDNVKSIPSFLDEIQNGNKDLKSELAEIQVQYVESIHELEKTRSLLRVQGDINGEQKREIEALQNRLQQVKAEYHGQIIEYKKLLDMRASRIQKLEIQVRESAYGNLHKNVMKSATESGAVFGKETSVHTASGQSLFEIHVQKVQLTQETLVFLGMTEPKIFATWAFYDHDLQYTPMAQGPQAQFDSSSYYKIKLDDSLLDYLSEHCVQMDLHLVTGNDCRHVGVSLVKLAEVLDYPANKLHGSTILYGAGEENKEKVIGTLDYWFKLHTAATKRIQEWLEHKMEVKRMLASAEKQQVLSEIQLLEGENEVLAQKTNTLPLRPKPRPEQELVPSEAKDKLAIKAKSKEPKSITDSSNPDESQLRDKPISKPQAGSPRPESQQDPGTKKTTKQPSPQVRRLPKVKRVVKQPSSSSEDETSSSEEIQIVPAKPKTKLRHPRPLSAKIGTQESRKTPPVPKIPAPNQASSSSSSSSDESSTSKSDHPNIPQKKEPPLRLEATALRSDPPNTIPPPKTTPVLVAGGAIEETSSSEEDVGYMRGEPAKPEIVVIEKPPTTPPKPARRNVGKSIAKDEHVPKETNDKASESRKPWGRSATRTPETIREESSEATEKSEELPTKRDDAKGPKGEDKSKEEEPEIKEENIETKKPGKKSFLQRLGSKFKSLDKRDEKSKSKEQLHEAKTPEPPRKPTEDEKLADPHEISESSDEDDEDDSKSESGAEDESKSTSSHKTASRTLSVTQQGSTGTDHSISQDSEGVVMRRHSPNTQRASIPNLDVVVINVSEFRVTNKNAKFLRDDTIEKLYVEYKFLDIPPKELETPFSLPKPKKLGDSIVFNFRKAISLNRSEHSNRRRSFARMLQGDGGTSSKMVFTVVSEPLGDSEHCEDVGTAEVDLAGIWKSGKDLLDCNVHVIGDGKKGVTEPIGTLTISIQANEVIKSLKI